MDFADACVARLAELHKVAVVCTSDRHFRIVRPHDTETMFLVAPFNA